MTDEGFRITTNGPRFGKATILRLQDQVQILIHEGDEWKARAEKAEAEVAENTGVIQLLRRQREQAEAELRRMHQEMAHRVGIEDKIRHLIDPEGKRICGTDSMVEELLLDLRNLRTRAEKAEADATCPAWTKPLDKQSRRENELLKAIHATPFWSNGFELARTIRCLLTRWAAEDKENHD